MGKTVSCSEAFQGGRRFALEHNLFGDGSPLFRKGKGMSPTSSGKFFRLQDGKALNPDLLRVLSIGEERLEVYYTTAPGVAPSATASGAPAREADGHGDDGGDDNDDDDDDLQDDQDGQGGTPDENDADEDEQAASELGGIPPSLACRFRAIGTLESDVRERSDFERRRHTEESTISLWAGKDTGPYKLINQGEPLITVKAGDTELQARRRREIEVLQNSTITTSKSKNKKAMAERLGPARSRARLNPELALPLAPAPVTTLAELAWPKVRDSYPCEHPLIKLPSLAHFCALSRSPQPPDAGADDDEYDASVAACAAEMRDQNERLGLTHLDGDDDAPPFPSTTPAMARAARASGACPSVVTDANLTPCGRRFDECEDFTFYD